MYEVVKSLSVLDSLNSKLDDTFLSTNSKMMETTLFRLLAVLMTFQAAECGCSCQAWCQKNDQPYGICGDGHTCICSSEPIKNSDHGCGCNKWCRGRGYSDGICGDGHTCLCSGKTDSKGEEHIRGQYKLTIIDNDADGLDERTRQEIIDTFFHVYPRILSRFNRQAKKDIRIKIDPNYDGVAYTVSDQIVISATYLRNHPRDIDLVTHELMHVVQSYPDGQPVWLVEGIADYVRWKYGRDNAGANWHLPSFDRTQRYTDSYAVTGRFLVWLERHVDRNIVDRLDRALRGDQYRSGQIWKQMTGKSIDQLWSDYASKSSL